METNKNTDLKIPWIMLKIVTVLAIVKTFINIGHTILLGLFGVFAESVISNELGKQGGWSIIVVIFMFMISFIPVIIHIIIHLIASKSQNNISKHRTIVCVEAIIDLVISMIEMIIAILCINIITAILDVLVIMISILVIILAILINSERAQSKITTNDNIER